MAEEVIQLQEELASLKKELKRERKSHKVTLRRTEDLQSRIEEELISFGYAKSFMEDLQIRVDEEMRNNAYGHQEIEDLHAVFEEALETHCSNHNKEELYQQVEDLQIRLDEELESYAHAKAFIEDLQNRLEEEIQISEHLRSQENDLRARINDEIEKGVSLRARLEALELSRSVPASTQDIAPVPPPPLLELLFFPMKEFSPRYGKTFFSMQIESYTILPNPSASMFCISRYYVVYNIKVMNGSATWYVQRRFSEFCKLFSSSSHDCIELPPKTLLPSFDDDFLKGRQSNLHSNLVAYLSIESKNGTVLSNAPLIEFLRLNESKEIVEESVDT